MSATALDCYARAQTFLFIPVSVIKILEELFFQIMVLETGSWNLVTSNPKVDKTALMQGAAAAVPDSLQVSFQSLRE